MIRVLSFCFFFFSFQTSIAQYEVQQLYGLIQGSTYNIQYCDSLNRDFYSDVENLLYSFDKSLSTYDSTSIISRVNRNDSNLIVDEYFITCFNKAKEVWENTDGAFDPTVYPLVNAWGFGPGKKIHVTKEIIDSILPFVGFDLIELRGNIVFKKDHRVALDFNAFAQGYSVDIVAEFFETKKISSYLIEIGGEVFAKGIQPNSDNWLIGIEKPIDNQTGINPLEVIAILDGQAIATSGNYRKFIIEDGVKYAHQLDPKSGYPIKNTLLSVSVFAKDCITADAYATGLSVMGLEKAKSFLLNHPELEALLIYSDGNGAYQSYQSKELFKILMSVDE